MKSGWKKILSILLLALWVNLPAAEKNRMELGINLSNPGLYWETETVFADAMKSSRHWDKGGENWAKTDENYWPTEDANVIVFERSGDCTGTYRLSFEGKAKVSAVSARVEDLAYDAEKNRSSARVVIDKKQDRTMLILRFTETDGGVRNVKLMRPIRPGSEESFPEDTLFTPEFFEKISEYTTVRALGWGAINWSPESKWSERTLWCHSHQSPNPLPGKEYNWEGRGAAWEYLIMAANEGKKDLWICIPHQADDEYIRKLARLCKYGSDGREPYKSKVENPVFPPLDPELNLYVEYSNEIWNFQFSQTPWCREQGKAHGHPLNFDGESDEITLMFRFKAMRSVQMSLIFRSVFGDKEMMSRVRPVICWQQGYEDLINRTLSFVDRYYGGKDSRSDYGKLQDVKTTTTIQGDTTITTTTGVMSNGEVKPVNYFFYGGGGTGYWYSDGKTTLTEDTIWDNAGWNAFGTFTDEWKNNRAGYFDKMCTDAAWARLYGLVYLNYEGDAHPSFQNNDGDIMRKTHWDPRMQENTLEHLRAVNQAGSGLFNFLSAGGYGDKNYWAVRNYGSDNPEDSPQWLAVKEFNRAAPQELNLGTMAPFKRDGNAYDTPRRQPEATGSKLIKPNDDQNVSYLFRVPKSGKYELNFELNVTDSHKVELMIDGKNRSTSSGSVKMNEDPSVKQDVVKASAEARRKVNMTPFFITDSRNYEEGVLYSVRLIVVEGEVEIVSVSLK